MVPSGEIIYVENQKYKFSVTDLEVKSINHIGLNLENILIEMEYNSVFMIPVNTCLLIKYKQDE